MKCLRDEFDQVDSRYKFQVSKVDGINNKSEINHSITPIIRGLIGANHSELEGKIASGSYISISRCVWSE